jgi:hypothetical protein
MNRTMATPSRCYGTSGTLPGMTDRAPDDLSPLARAYGQMWDVLRSDTDHVLVDLYRCDRDLVEKAAAEWIGAHPDYIDNPPPPLERPPEPVDTVGEEPERP